MSSCPVREQLAAKYIRALENYAHTVSALATSHGFIDAASHCVKLYNACKEAKSSLHSHEAAHGCRQGISIKTRTA